MTGLDDTDRALVSLLRENARMPVAALAQALGVSRGTAQARLDRLVERGVVLGFTLRLRPDADPRRVRAITTVAVEGERTQAVVRSLRGMPEVAAIHSTNGRWDLVVELATEDLAGFDAALQRLRMVRGIANTETSLLLSSYKV